MNPFRITSIAGVIAVAALGVARQRRGAGHDHDQRLREPDAGQRHDLHVQHNGGLAAPGSGWPDGLFGHAQCDVIGCSRRQRDAVGRLHGRGSGNRCHLDQEWCCVRWRLSRFPARQHRRKPCLLHVPGRVQLGRRASADGIVDGHGSRDRGAHPQHWCHCLRRLQRPYGRLYHSRIGQPGLLGPDESRRGRHRTLPDASHARHASQSRLPGQHVCHDPPDLQAVGGPLRPSAHPAPISLPDAGQECHVDGPSARGRPTQLFRIRCIISLCAANCSMAQSNALLAWCVEDTSKCKIRHKSSRLFRLREPRGPT